MIEPPAALSLTPAENSDLGQEKKEEKEKEKEKEKEGRVANVR
jgi:hypothetical protein